MKKDIPQIDVKNVALAITKDTNEEGGTNWYVYLVNMNDVALTDAIINSKGYGTIGEEQKKTSVLRHYFETIDAQSYVKIEMIVEDVFGLSNEYWVSYYIGKQIYDKKYVFLPETITESNYTTIPLMDKKGVMIG